MSEMDFKETAPTLVFGEVEEMLTEKQPPAEASQAQKLKEDLNDSILSDEERRQVDEFAKQIDLHN